MTVPLCDTEGPLVGDNGKPSTITVRISIWEAPEPGKVWWQVLARWLFIPCMALGVLLGLSLLGLGLWMLWRPAPDCWEANLPSTKDLFGTELSRCVVVAPTASVENAENFVTLRWPKVSGAVGYRIQEWSWQNIQTGWYDTRQEEDSFSFLYNYGGTELPSCGTAYLLPQAKCNQNTKMCEISLTGRANLDVEWRYHAIKEPTGEASRWSPPSNRMQLPMGLLSVPFDMSALSDPNWKPAPLGLDNTCCPVGSYTAAVDVGTESCTFCPAGESSKDGVRGASQCEVCPAGRYADAANADANSAALAYKFSENEEGFDGASMDGLACTPCGFGRFASDPGTAACEECPLGWTSFRGATWCWIWFPWPIALAVTVCAVLAEKRRRHRNRLREKYSARWLNNMSGRKAGAMSRPLSSRWRGDKLGQIEDGSSTLALVAHGMGTHAAKAMGQAAEVGIRAATGLPKPMIEPEPGPESDEPMSRSTALALLESQSSVCLPSTPEPEPEPEPEVKKASYRTFKSDNVHQVYAHGSEYAAHHPLFNSDAGKGVGTPLGKSGAGLLSAVAVQDELRELLLRATAEAGDSWSDEDREECRVNFELIAEDAAAASETGVTVAQLGDSVTAVLEALPGSLRTLAKAEPPSPATQDINSKSLAVVNTLPAPEGMEWMVARRKAAIAKKKKEAEEERKRQELKDELMKADREEERQNIMREAALGDGKAGAMELRKSAAWIKAVASNLTTEEWHARIHAEKARLAAIAEANRLAREAALAAAKAKADAEAETARKKSQAEIPIRAAKHHTQMDHSRAIAARVARAAGSATAVGVIMTMELAASAATLPELGIRPYVKNAWDSDSDTDGSYETDTDDDDDSRASSYTSDEEEDVVSSTTGASLEEMRAERRSRDAATSLRQISEDW